MRILVVNRQFFILGGPDKYLFSLIEMMPQHEIMPFALKFKQNVETPYSRYFLPPPGRADAVRFDDYHLGLIGKLKLMADSVYHFEARRRLERMIVETKPDLALFLGALYFSDSLLDACRKYRLPIICRLSDFSRICSAAVLFRDGRVCEECIEKGLLAGVVHRCGGNRKSLGAAIIRGTSLALSKMRRAEESVKLFISPSEHTKSIMVKAGYDRRKIRVVPTFVNAPEKAPATVPDRHRLLYVGRISPEKGVHILIQAFERIDDPLAVLTIAGDLHSDYADGLRAKISERSRNRIVFAGYKSQSELSDLFLSHTFFVVPSVWYENMPNVLLEGMSRGRPALASRLGSLCETIRDKSNGLFFEPGDSADLAEKIKYLLRHPDEAMEMGRNAFHDARIHYSPKAHISALEQIFRSCLETRREETIREPG